MQPAQAMPAQAMPVQLQLAQAIRQTRHKESSNILEPATTTPVRDVLRHLSQHVPHATALFLGCGDGSCLLASLAEHHPGLSRLSAVLNDHNATMLARATLILLMASELDPNSRKDMQVLWEVWYCSTWGPGTWPRAKPFLERLLQGSVPWLKPLHSNDTSSLQRVWRSWLERKPKPYTGLVSRDMENIKSRMNQVNPQTGEHATAEEYFQHWLQHALQLVVKLGSLDTLDSALAGTPYSSFEDIVRQELTTWFRTGAWAAGFTGEAPSKSLVANITPDETAWRCTTFSSPMTCWGPFTAAELQSACLSGSPSGVLARACIARISQVVRGFQQNVVLGSQHEAAVAAAAAGGSSVGCSSSRGGVHLHVQLACCDAVQLCFGMPLTIPVDGPSPVPSPAASSHKRAKAKAGKATSAPASTSPPLDPPQLFDVIETSTLADELGLLPLLIAAGPRLKPGGHMYTSMTEWTRTHLSVESHLLERALLMPLTLAPTVLGLRLLTDLALDRPETSDALDTCHLIGFKELVWSSLPSNLHASPLPQLQPQVLGGPKGSIEAVLQALADYCCVKHLPGEWAGGNLALERGTPHLLAWLLASMIQRVDMSALLDSSSGSSGSTSSNSSAGAPQRGSHKHTAASSGSTEATSVQSVYARTHRLLVALRSKVAPQLPAQYQLAFKAGMDKLRSSLQQNAPQSWLPADVPSCPGVLQLPLKWEAPLEQLTKLIELRVIIIDRKTAKDQPAELLGYSTIMAENGSHIFDLVSAEGQKCILTLPTDHALDMQHISITVQCVSRGAPPDQPVPLSCYTVQAPATLAQVLLPAACPVTAALLPPSTTSMLPKREDTTAVLCIKSCREDADSYEVALKPEPSCSQAHIMRMEGVEVMLRSHSSKQGSDTHVAALPCYTRHQVCVHVEHPVVQPVELTLPWPVAAGLGETSGALAGAYTSGYGIKYETKAEGLLLLKLRKAKVWEMWPGDEHWPGAAAPLNLSKLAPVDGTMQKSLLQHCAVAQLNRPEFLQMNRYKDPLDGLRQLLITLLSWSQLHQDPDGQVTSFTLELDRPERPGEDRQIELIMRAHHPWLMTDAGRPVLPVTVVDVRMCQHVPTAEHGSKAEVDSVFAHHRHLGTQEVEPEVCKLFKRMLLRNASACIPTAAQLASLPTGVRPPWWYCSYLSFMAEPGPAPRAYSVTRSTNVSAAAISAGAYRIMELQAQFDASKSAPERVALGSQLAVCLDLPGADQLPKELADKARLAAEWWASRNDGPAGSVCAADELGTQPCDAEATPACAQCGKKDCKLLKCGKCGAVQYCSRECQVADWKQHKTVCSKGAGLRDRQIATGQLPQHPAAGHSSNAPAMTLGASSSPTGVALPHTSTNTDKVEANSQHEGPMGGAAQPASNLLTEPPASTGSRRPLPAPGKLHHQQVTPFYLLQVAEKCYPQRDPQRQAKLQMVYDLARSTQRHPDILFLAAPYPLLGSSCFYVDVFQAGQLHDDNLKMFCAWEKLCFPKDKYLRTVNLRGPPGEPPSKHHVCGIRLDLKALLAAGAAHQVAASMPAAATPAAAGHAIAHHHRLPAAQAGAPHAATVAQHAPTAPDQSAPEIQHQAIIPHHQALVQSNAAGPRPAAAVMQSRNVAPGAASSQHQGSVGGPVEPSTSVLMSRVTRPTAAARQQANAQSRLVQASPAQPTAPALLGQAGTRDSLGLREFPADYQSAAARRRFEMCLTQYRYVYGAQLPAGATLAVAGDMAVAATRPNDSGSSWCNWVLSTQSCPHSGVIMTIICNADSVYPRDDPNRGLKLLAMQLLLTRELEALQHKDVCLLGTYSVVGEELAECLHAIVKGLAPISLPDMFDDIFFSFHADGAQSYIRLSMSALSAAGVFGELPQQHPQLLQQLLMQMHYDALNGAVGSSATQYSRLCWQMAMMVGALVIYARTSSKRTATLLGVIAQPSAVTQLQHVGGATWLCFHYRQLLRLMQCSGSWSAAPAAPFTDSALQQVPEDELIRVDRAQAEVVGLRINCTAVAAMVLQAAAGRMGSTPLPPPYRNRSSLTACFPPTLPPDLPAVPYSRQLRGLVEGTLHILRDPESLSCKQLLHAAVNCLSACGPAWAAVELVTAGNQQECLLPQSRQERQDLAEVYAHKNATAGGAQVHAQPQVLVASQEQEDTALDPAVVQHLVPEYTYSDACSICRS